MDELKKAYAWQEAIELAKQLVAVCEEFRDPEANVLVWHLRQAMVDIPAGVAADLQAERPASLEALLQKVVTKKSTDTKLVLISHEELAKLLDPLELELIDRINQTDPALYGFKGPNLGLEEPGNDLVALEGQHYTYKGAIEKIGTQYLPPSTFHDYLALKIAIQRNIGSDLLVVSSYRSPAYQALTFLKILQISKFDIKKAAQRCAIPGFSEHGTLSSLAVDFINQDGIPDDVTPQNFKLTKEYAWLQTHAADYNFFLSYPEDNTLGVTFEPWHWRHKPPLDLHF